MMLKGGPQMTGSTGKGGPMGGPLGGPMGVMRPPMPLNMLSAMGHGPSIDPVVESTLSAASLAAAPPHVQKQMLGEKLFPAIAEYQPVLAGKITRMMLEMDNSELLILLESEVQLRAKVDEALRVLDVST